MNIHSFLVCFIFFVNIFPCPFFRGKTTATLPCNRCWSILIGTVEINNTFYRMPSVSVLEAWAGEVPADFKFVLKASRQITHMKRLKDAGDSVSYLLEAAGALKEHLGPLLFQLPPNLKKDVPRLREFLALLPLAA